jgi:hypothetical protein
MLEYRSINTGKLYKSKETEHFLNKCPVCKSELLWNSYKDLQVSSMDDNDCMSCDIKIEYCNKCCDWYIYIW